MELARTPHSAWLQLGPVQSSGLVSLQITRVLFPKTYTTLIEVRAFADSLNFAVANGSGEAVLVADPVQHDQRRYTEIRLIIESSRPGIEFSAHGILSSAFDTEERFPGNMRITWPREFFMKNLLTLTEWCAIPTVELNLPLRVDA